MMRKVFYFAGTVLLASVLLASCDSKDENGGEQTSLDAPVPFVTMNDKGFSVTWEPVDHAYYYDYSLNGEDAKSTSQCEAVFTDLDYGSYEFKVKAVAAPNSGYSDSEWTVETVAIELGDDWFEISRVYLDNDDVFNYYDYNSVFFDFAGYELDSVYLAVLESSVIVGLNDSKISALLTTRLNAEGISQINKNGQLTGLAFNGLKSDTEYVVAARALHQSGAEKVVVSDPISTEPMPYMPDELAEWMGTYEVVASETLEMSNQNGAAAFRVLDTPVEFSIRIEPNPVKVSSLYIYGLGVICKDLGIDMPALAELADDGVSLDLVSGYVTYDGKSLVWLPVCELEDGSFSFLTTGYDYMIQFRNDGSSITGVPFSGVQADIAYTVSAVDLFGMGAVGINIYHPNLPALMPAGEYTLTKVADGQPMSSLLVPGKSGKVSLRQTL